MARKQLVEAVAYFRTSSATNVGADKDSEKRQRAAIEAFAKRAGYVLVDTFYDADVRGSDPVDVRPGFAAMLDRIAGNGLRTIIVETANRFSRDLIVQETGHRFLKDQGITLIAADSPETFVEDTPTSDMLRQILGAVSQFEKASLVAKLKGARERKMKEQAAAGEKVKCGGRSYRELNGAMVDLARKLHRYPVNGRRRSLREVSAGLAEAGHCAVSGKPFGAEAIKRMVRQ
ncbi:recombinase family protein [Methylobacterium sp. P1-11]|nr:recombinase family protein [Methylobacterium sp. P1-11]